MQCLRLHGYCAPPSTISITSNFVLFQTVPARNPEDGQRRGLEPPDLLLLGVARTHLPLVGQLPGVDEHGDAGHAAGLEDP